MRDHLGHVIGRQLIALDAGGRLWGFRPYGAGAEEGRRSRPWVEILLALLCVDIAAVSGARLGQPEKQNESPLRLFAAWYDDGARPFDWWVERVAAAAREGHSASGAEACARVAAVLEQDDSAWAVSEEQREATLRALLFPGDDAVPFLEDYRLGIEGWAYLRRHTRSEAVRAAL